MGPGEVPGARAGRIPDLLGEWSVQRLKAAGAQGRFLRRYEHARQIDTWAMGELTDALWLGLTQAPPWARRRRASRAWPRR